MKETRRLGELTNWKGRKMQVKLPTLRSIWQTLKLKLFLTKTQVKSQSRMIDLKVETCCFLSMCQSLTMKLLCLQATEETSQSDSVFPDRTSDNLGAISIHDESLCSENKSLIKTERRWWSLQRGTQAEASPGWCLMLRPWSSCRRKSLSSLRWERKPKESKLQSKKEFLSSKVFSLKNWITATTSNNFVKSHMFKWRTLR